MPFLRATQPTGFKILPALLLLLAACVSNPRPELGVVNEELGEDEGIVFGTLDPIYYNSKGKQIAGNDAPEIKYELFLGAAENLGVKRAFSGFNESMYGNTKQPETFFVLKLPEGEYSMFKLQKPTAPDKPVRETPGTSFPADVRFTVAPKQATYIGALQIEFRGVRGALGQERIGEKVTFSVVDKADTATKTYQQRNPDLKYTVGKNLMLVKKPR